MILAVAYSVIRHALGYGIDLSNPVNIIINIFIYMIFPVGDKLYSSCCVCATKYCFFCWYDRYTKTQECLVIQLASNQYENANRDSLIQTADVTLQVANQRKTELDSYDVMKQNQRFEIANDTTKTARGAVERDMTNLSSLLPDFTDNLLF